MVSYAPFAFIAHILRTIEAWMFGRKMDVRSITQAELQELEDEKAMWRICCLMLLMIAVTLSVLTVVFAFK